MHGVEFAS